jgi:hypothetical protein
LWLKPAISSKEAEVVSSEVWRDRPENISKFSSEANSIPNIIVGAQVAVPPSTACCPFIVIVPLFWPIDLPTIP